MFGSVLTIGSLALSWVSPLWITAKSLWKLPAVKYSVLTFVVFSLGFWRGYAWEHSNCDDRLVKAEKRFERSVNAANATAKSVVDKALQKIGAEKRGLERRLHEVLERSVEPEATADLCRVEVAPVAPAVEAQEPQTKAKKRRTKVKSKPVAVESPEADSVSLPRIRTGLSADRVRSLNSIR